MFALQYWFYFCHTPTWITHRYIYVPSPLESLFHLLPILTLLGYCRAPVWVPWVIQQISHWLSILHTVMYVLEMPSSIMPPWSTEFIPEYELCFPLNLLKPCSDLAHQTLVKREGFLSWFEENIRKPMAGLLLIPGSDRFLFSPGRSFDSLSI